ncbi:hypothetical protein JZ751_000736 [Albula glossodonta]|uniref:MENTAL domain-containing protein n=1 Tax=Albula glossodonta TaxID=121402 RepID=A0A8T2PWK2_9TELE|nr:hypothetical protein JZ751_000736 [Albula glossodonta]
MDAPPTALPESTARPQSHDTGQKCISDIRRTFCLFVTFDLLFVSLLWIIELNVNGKIKDRVVDEVLHFDYHSSFFDIFVLAVLRFLALILAYAAFKLHHWWVIAITTAITSVAVTVKVFFATVGAFQLNRNRIHF